MLDYRGGYYYINNRRVRGLIPIGLSGNYVGGKNIYLSALSIDYMYIDRSNEDKYNAMIYYQVRGHHNTTSYPDGRVDAYLLCLVDYTDSQEIEPIYPDEVEETHVFG